MMDLVLADGYAKQIGGLLETIFGVVGKDLYTQCKMVKGRLDPEIIKQILYVADLHYKLANRPGYNLALDKAAFLSSCQQIITHLSQIQSQQALHIISGEKWYWRDLASGLFVNIWYFYDSFLELYKAPFIIACGLIAGTMAAHNDMSYGFVAVFIVVGVLLGLLSSAILAVILLLSGLGVILAALVAVSLLLSKLL